MNKLFLAGICIATFSIGALWYAFHSQIITISFPAYAEYVAVPTNKKTIVLWWYTQTGKTQEKTDIIWQDDTVKNIITSISTWIGYLQEEEVLDKRIRLETAALSATGREAYISLSHTLFNPELSIIKKWHLLEGLFLTLKPLFPDLQNVRLFVNGKPLHDEHIDCSKGLPILPFLQTYKTTSQPIPTQKKVSTIIINPSGDKQRTGRIITREFERKFTRLMAQRIQEILHRTGAFKVFITHEIGQIEDHEQSASLANRLSADLYIYLNCFEGKELLPEIGFYFSVYNPTTDFWQKKNTHLTLLPIDKAHIKNIVQSFTLCFLLESYFKESMQQYIFVNQTYGLPLTQLVGIHTPSCIIECGLQTTEQAEQFAHTIAHSCIALL